jgi:hypothetical protein
MSTRRQRAASRANGQKSQGPITEAGKANSRYNALKHGIDAKQQIMFTESAEDLALLAVEYHELHCPANADQRFLVDTMINNEWRLRRLRCVEADLWRATHNLVLEKNAGIEAADFGDAFTASGPAFERLQRIINSCERHYRNARKDLEQMQSNQAAPAIRNQPQTTVQPEETKTTSESSGSIRTSPESAPATSPELPPNPPKTAPAPEIPFDLAAKVR